MTEKKSAGTNRTLYRTPFSRGYWVQAAAEFKDLKVLLFAALMIALRVALKPVGIPIAADLRINTAFFINAFGAMVYGPVVAIPAAAITDTLGYLLYPNGVYFFPFIFTEIAGSVIFALFLYRAEVSTLRVTLSRFCICFFVNIVLNTPIMALYYQMVMGKNYPLFDWIRIVKNLAMFPIESILLTLFLRVVVPPMQKLGYVHSSADKLRFARKQVIALVALLLIGIGAVAGYAVNDYNTKSFSAGYSAQERLNRNREMNAWAAREQDRYPEEEMVTVIQSARSRVGDPHMTYELALYRVDQAKLAEKSAADAGYSLDTLHGYSKSKAAADDTLIRVGEATAVTDKKTQEHLEMTIRWDEE
ncbi:MAG: folate family ECF transporter S component [Clostridia bacterium]|nr:folate family ECF transporter S component [Clostridia bacterium]